jgi:hypothetical protein
MKVGPYAILACSTCGVEGAHELPYLSGHLCASQCAKCGVTRHYSGSIYGDYAESLAERIAWLPLGLAKGTVSRPARLLRLPVKAVRKSFGLLKEVNQVDLSNSVGRSLQMVDGV